MEIVGAYCVATPDELSAAATAPGLPNQTIAPKRAIMRLRRCNESFIVSFSLKSFDRDFAATERQIKEEVAEFEHLVEYIKTEAVKLKNEKKGFMSRVELSVLAAYKNILAKDKGKPVVPIENGSCGHCSLKVTPQLMNEAKKGSLVFCDNCSHILYDPSCEP